jgi:hypothetical protein
MRPDQKWQTNNSIILSGQHDSIVKFPTIFSEINSSHQHLIPLSHLREQKKYYEAHRASALYKDEWMIYQFGLPQQMVCTSNLVNRQTKNTPRSLTSATCWFQNGLCWSHRITATCQDINWSQSPLKPEKWPIGEANTQFQLLCTCLLE